MDNDAKKLRELARDELEIRLRDLEEEYRNLRFRSALQQETNPVRMRERDAARQRRRAQRFPLFFP